jgi:hypothetical protein
MNYITTHWRGQQGLLRSTLINGVLAYLVLIIISVGLGSAFQITGAAVLVVVAIILVWMVWAAVGIVRCGLRNALDSNSRTAPRIGGVIAIAGVLAIAYFTTKDLVHLGLFRWLWNAV